MEVILWNTSCKLKDRKLKSKLGFRSIECNNSYDHNSYVFKQLKKHKVLFLLVLTNEILDLVIFLLDPGYGNAIMIYRLFVN